jgi:hypothetical protein
MSEEHRVLNHKEFLEAYRYDVSRDLWITEVDIKTFISLKVAEKSFNLLLKQAENKAMKLRQDLRSIDQMLEELKNEPEEAKIKEKK